MCERDRCLNNICKRKQENCRPVGWVWVIVSVFQCGAWTALRGPQGNGAGCGQKCTQRLKPLPSLPPSSIFSWVSGDPSFCIAIYLFIHSRSPLPETFWWGWKAGRARSHLALPQSAPLPLLRPCGREGEKWSPTSRGLTCPGRLCSRLWAPRVVLRGRQCPEGFVGLQAAFAGGEEGQGGRG